MPEGCAGHHGPTGLSGPLRQGYGGLGSPAKGGDEAYPRRSFIGFHSGFLLETSTV